MRIVGEVPHPTFKITIFQMDSKLSVKLERGLLEQTYKFRRFGLVERVEEVHRLLDDDFLKRVEAMFDTMDSSLKAAIDRNRDASAIEGEFEEII